jgi:deoxyribodipyrimidine photo-lyase
MAAAGRTRREQLLAHLGALNEQLVDLGGSLVIRPGPAAVAVPVAVAECQASSLYVNIDASPFSMDRDEAVDEALGIPTHRFNGLTVHEPGAVLTKKGTLSQVFTPFYKTWANTPLTPWPSGGPGRPISMSGLPIPESEGPIHHDPGESGAWQRVNAWLERVDSYPDTRDLPAITGTSELSADLKFGTLSARTLADVVGTHTPGRAAYVRQLAWRDWWVHTLAIRPDLPDVALKPQYDNIAWRDDPDGFGLWCTGRTGYPIVDAGMRQLVQTGWMHNRVRMICASFLVKDLLIDWRRGERFFRHHLVDADVAQNAGNWQWIAGTGPDAAPYFRVFNPTSQGRKFDPGADFIRRWVPELASVPAAVIHQPGRAISEYLSDLRIVGEEVYPVPVVDHRLARTRALETYKRALV